jgi:hypothetical protein
MTSDSFQKYLVINTVIQGDQPVNREKPFVYDC